MSNKTCITLLVFFGFLQIGSGSTELFAQESSHPAQWIGDWHGEMINHSPEGAGRSIPVSLTISALPDGSLRFRTVYNNDEIEGLRDYILIPDSLGANQFVLDEQNGILLRAQLIAGVLIEAFEVGTRQLTSRYQLDADGRLVHEVAFWNGGDVVTTTGSGVAGENGTPVHSFYVAGIQRTVFRRLE